MGAEATLLARGVELVNMESDACINLMYEFISAHPDIWNEDIGE